MSVAKITEITSESSESFDDAIHQGIRRASQTLDNIRGAWIKDQELVCTDNEVSGYRVTMKITFVLNQEEDDNGDEEDAEEEEEEEDEEEPDRD